MQVWQISSSVVRSSSGTEFPTPRRDRIFSSRPIGQLLSGVAGQSGQQSSDHFSFPPVVLFSCSVFFISRRPTANRGHREPVGSCSSVREVRFHVVAESNFAWRIPAFLPIPGNGRLWGLASPAFLLCRVRGQCVEDPFLEREAMIGVDSLFGFLLRPGLLLRYWCVSLEEPFQARDDTALRRKRRRGHVRDPSLSKQ